MKLLGTSKAFKNRAAQILSGLALLCFAFPVAASEIRIAVSKTPLSLPFFVAQEKKFFEKQGVSPELIQCLGGVKCLQLMLDGKSDLATCSELPIVFNSFDRSDFALLASFVTNKNDMKFIARGNSNFSKPDDFKKLKVGVVRRSASQYFFDVFMLFQGVDPADVDQVGMKPDELPSALASGKVDAIAAWEPFGYLGLKAVTDAKEVAVPNLYTQTFNLVSKKSAINSNAAEITSIMKALQMSINFINQNPEESKKILKDSVGLDAQFIEKAWSSYRFELALRQSLVTTMVDQAKWAMREDHVRPDAKAPNLLNVIDARLIKKISPGTVNLLEQ